MSLTERGASDTMDDNNDDQIEMDERISELMDQGDNWHRVAEKLQLEIDKLMMSMQAIDYVIKHAPASDGTKLTTIGRLAELHLDDGDGEN